MKIFYIVALFFLSTTCTAQVDSAWIAEYVKGFSTDTGRYLPGINLVDESGNKKTLADFKGKVLYIDVWTTWCGNCIIRFPYAKQLYARLKAIHLDTAIQFINICSEDSKREWKKMLTKHQPVGINLYAKDTSFYKTWKVEAFPCYLFIDREGKIMAINGPSVDDGSVDYALYAATKGIKPATAVRISFRQQQYYQRHQRFTDDPEGTDYKNWYDATVDKLFADWKERNEQLKQTKR